MDHSIYAGELFMNGSSCSQAVFLAFCDVTGIDRKLAAKIASPFGGGIGRMREVCGAVSGMYMVLGALYGYDETAEDDGRKKQLYKDVQALAEKFKQENGSIICRELLGLDIKGKDNPTPEERTEKYYKKRPCSELCRYAADLVAEYLEL